MKSLLLLVLLTTASAQQAPPPAKSLAGLKRHANARHVMSTPKARRPHGISANSTAHTLAARQPKPMPALPAFAVTSLDGNSRNIATLAPQSKTTAPVRWILIYLHEGAPGTDTFLESLAALKTGPLQRGAKTVIIVLPKGQNGSQSLAMLQNTTPLAQAAWAHDATHAALGQLKPHGLPAVYAMEGSKIVWQQHGLQGSPDRIIGLASDWASHDPAPLNTVASMVATARTAAANAAQPQAGTHP